ncbi:MAG: Hsp70 family protein [Desulfobacteraceae bacterium]
MDDTRYIIGIDLGTTNSVAAYIDTSEADAGNLTDSEVRIFKIPQLTQSGVLEKMETLPSFLYMLEEGESDSPAFQLPWQGDVKTAAGVYARDRGSEVPHRLIASSKSWLCSPAVDRNAPILPWEGGEKQGKLSPVQASAAVLAHIRDAWNHEMAGQDRSLNLENQAIYLTVPASFDAVARQLTVKAAEAAGLKNIVLIEEPQAAFYSWIDQSKDKWRDEVETGDLVLVCDIGGGTSDFSLISVQEGDSGQLELERVAVGDHLLVGGDNIDLTLSYHLSTLLKEKGKKLDSWQMRGLIHSCRKAKEVLFSEQGSDTYPITILGRGSGLIKGTIKTELAYQTIESIILEGFFPKCRLEDRPVSASSPGIKDFGLSYAADPCITKHLAAFLSAHRNGQGEVQLPTAVVFNGGVMKSPVLRNRILTTLSDWRDSLGQTQIRRIDSRDLDLSVAWGAACYGMAARGDGIRIRSGLGRSYYMAIETAMPAVPGMVLPTRALCIAPFGMEEGSGAKSTDRLYNLVVGQPVRFDIMTSSRRHDDDVGMVIDNWEDNDIEALTTIETTLDGEDGTLVPVTFEVRLTEVGTLEFWACARDDDKKWRLELNVRSKD